MSLIVICDICGTHTGASDGMPANWSSLWVKRHGDHKELHMCAECEAGHYKLEDLDEG